MSRSEREFARVIAYEARGRIAEGRPLTQAQIEFLSAYDEEYEPPQERHVPRGSKVPDWWPVPVCVVLALTACFPRQMGLALMFGIAVVGASLAIALAYDTCRRRWPDVRALWRRLPDVGDICILIPAAALAYACGVVARDARLLALSWRVVLLASVELAGMPPVAHQEPQAEAFAFELDLAKADPFAAIKPF